MPLEHYECVCNLFLQIYLGFFVFSEYEASHGTVSDLWYAHLDGETTSLNPLGLVEALIGAMNHSADLLPLNNEHVTEENGLERLSDEELELNAQTKASVYLFTDSLRKALHNTFRYGQGTKDMAGPSGLSTEEFVKKVAWRLGRYMAFVKDEVDPQQVVIPKRSFRRNCE